MLLQLRKETKHKVKGKGLIPGPLQIPRFVPCSEQNILGCILV